MVKIILINNLGMIDNNKYNQIYINNEFIGL